MFKKIVLTATILGIIGGLFAPVFSVRAWTETDLQKITISISINNVREDQATGKYIASIPVVINSNFKEFGDHTIHLDIYGAAPGGKAEKKISKEFTPHVDKPKDEFIEQTFLTQTDAVLERGYGYSAIAYISLPQLAGQTTPGQWIIGPNGIPVVSFPPKTTNTYTPPISNTSIFTIKTDGSTSIANEDSSGTQNTAQNVTSNEPSALPECNILYSSTWPGCIARVIYYIFFIPTSFVFGLSGQFLDWGTSFTIDSNSYKGSAATFIESGWKITRDIANILFIFILLWVGIGTILGSHSVDAKKTIGMVIIIALLLNFSLFFARVIIDASNILAGVFYNQIDVQDEGSNNQWVFSDKNVKNISTAIVSKFNPQKLFAQAGTLKINTGTGVKDGSTDGGTNGEPAPGQFIIITLIMSVINCIGIWVFFSVGFLFLSRVAGLWLAMIFAPLAFISYILPSSSAGALGDMHHSKWWGNLVRLAMMVPMFMFFMYLILMFMNTNFIANAMGDKTTTLAILGVVIPLLIIVVLLQRARKIVVDWSGELGKMAAQAGTAVAGFSVGALTGGAAMLGRGTIGRLANKAASSEELKDRAAKGDRMAKMQLKSAEFLSKSSFDARNTTVGNKVSQATGMNLNKGLSFAGLNTKSTEGGWVGLQAKKAEKEANRWKDSYDHHAYEQEEEKVNAEKEKQSKNKDIKEDIQNKIRVEKAAITTMADGSQEKKDAQQRVQKLTESLSIADANIRAYEKGGKTHAINSNGEYVDKNGKVVAKKEDAHMEESLGIQKMEKNKERIKTARQKNHESVLRRKSGKRYLDDERDELGNIKKFGEEITPGLEKKLRKEKDEKNKEKNEALQHRLDIGKDINDVNQKMKEAAQKVKEAQKKGDKALIKSTSDALKGLIEQRKQLEKSQNDAKEKSDTLVKEFNKVSNKLGKVEAANLKTNYNGVRQVLREFGEGAASGAVFGAAAGTAIPGAGTFAGAGVGAVIGGLRRVLEYSGTTNRSIANGHIPHYHGSGSTYREPSGGGQDTPSASSHSGGGGGGDHSHH